MASRRKSSVASSYLTCNRVRPGMLRQQQQENSEGQLSTVGPMDHRMAGMGHAAGPARIPGFVLCYNSGLLAVSSDK